MARFDVINKIEQFQADLTIKLLSSKRDSKDPSFTRDQKSAKETKVLPLDQRSSYLMGGKKEIKRNMIDS